ncbi:MAG: hypothetical protein KDA95_09905 [Acidimicrobiales bacterium]|nr:hypothetical protein [Acidimicrobiales bacterium]
MSNPFVGPTDESYHEPEPGLWWGESWYLDFVSPDDNIAGYIRLGLYPNQRVAWYWACLVGPERQLVTVLDHDINLPRLGTHEIRTEGLWADYTVETPLDHVSVGLEAFGIGLDDPSEIYGRQHGDVVPLGFDLEWETDGEVFAYPGVSRYEVPCRVHGEVLVGHESFMIDAYGQRDHSWGERDWWTYQWSWTSAVFNDRSRFHAVDVQVDGQRLYQTGYLQTADGRQEPATNITSSATLGQDQFPTSASWVIDGLEVEVEPIAFAPVHLLSPDGRQSRFPRAWCRFETADGRRGHGWTEWNQPQPPVSKQ